MWLAHGRAHCRNIGAASRKCKSAARDQLAAALSVANVGGVIPERVEIGGTVLKLHQSAGTLSLPERRFPPPWSVEETDACFIVRDHSAYAKFSDTGKSVAPGPRTRNLSLPGTIAGLPEVVPGVNIKETIQTVKFGINYRFGTY
jgi:hypothetical protein